MGQNTDAILCFGIDLGCTEEEGIDLPWVLEDDPEFEMFFDTWLESIGVAEPDCPLEEIQHGSADYVCRILAVRGTATIAPRGYPQKIDIEVLRNLALRPHLAHAWGKAHGLPVGDLKDWGWVLASDWGW